MPALSAPGEFVWVNLYTKEAFGLLEVSQGTRHALVYLKSPKEPEQLKMGIIEPDDLNTGYVGFVVTPP
jgi:hypothetical protein